MIRRLTDAEIKLLEDSTNKINKDELCLLKGRKPNDKEKQNIHSIGRFVHGGFISLRVFNIFAMILLISFCGTCTSGLVSKFIELSKDHIIISDHILLILVMFGIAIIDILTLILLIHMMINRFTNEKSQKLRQALKNHEYEILDAVPIGFQLYYPSNPEDLSTNYLAFKINGKDCFWFQIEGKYKNNGFNSSINKDNAMLLRFCVEVKKQIEYEYVAVVF